MNTTQKMIERVRARLPRQTDYMVAKALGISTQRISAYVNGVNELHDDDVICRAAKIVGDDPAFLIARFQRERATSDDAKAAWIRLETLAKRASRRGADAALAAA